MDIIQRSGDNLILNISGKKSLRVLFSLASGTAGLLILLTVDFFEDNPFLRSVFIAFAAFTILYGLYTLASSKTATVDRENQVLEIRSFCLGLCYHFKKVLLSQLEGVTIEYRKGESHTSGTGTYQRTPDVWSVYLVFGKSKKVKVCSGENEDQQKGIASALSEILGKNVKHTNAPPGLLERIFGGASDDYPSSRPPPYSL